MEHTKADVAEFWNRASCGEELLLDAADRAGYAEQLRRRYDLEPFIPGFAGFAEGSGKRVLEIGVGLGADHQCWGQSGADLFGVDLTDRAIEHARERLAVFGLKSTLAVGDAERLAFPDNSFDIVYSWGVLHHTPDTPRAFKEVLRVLRPGGVARIMIYSTWSIIGLMLWVRYALLKLRPWWSLKRVYAEYLESPGTKAYTIREAHGLMAGFTDVSIHTVLTHGDLLSSGAGQRHTGPLLSMARAVWPRWFIKALLPGRGLFMLIEGRKPA